MRAGVVASAIVALGFAFGAYAEEAGLGPALQLGPVLQEIKTTGKVKIGYRDASIPFSFLDRSGRPTGYSIELCELIVAQIAEAVDAPNLKVEYIKVTSETRLDAVAIGAIDLECGSTTSNLERAKRVAFSPMMFVAGTKLMTPIDSPAHDLPDLKGRTIAVTRGTTNATVLRALDSRDGLGLKLLVADDHDKAYDLLAEGKADAFATDDVLLYGLIARRRSEAKFHVIGELLSYDPYAVAFRKDDPSLKAAVDKTFADKTFADIGAAHDWEPLDRRWFQSRLPNGERLGIEMSSQLEEAFKSYDQAAMSVR